MKKLYGLLLLLLFIFGCTHEASKKAIQVGDGSKEDLKNKLYDVRAIQYKDGKWVELK